MSIIDNKWLTKVIAIVAIAGGISYLKWTMNPMKMYYKYHSYRFIIGSVVSASVDMSSPIRRGGGRRGGSAGRDGYRTNVVYDYTLDGKKYRGEKGVMVTFVRQGVDNKLHFYTIKPGDPVMVFYNPASPGQSMTQKSWDHLGGTLMWTIPFSTLGLLWIWFYFHILIGKDAEGSFSACFPEFIKKIFKKLFRPEK